MVGRGPDVLSISEIRVQAVEGSVVEDGAASSRHEDSRVHPR